MNFTEEKNELSKAKLIKEYRQARKRFDNLVVPDKDTPEIIRNCLEKDYNRILDWLKEVETYACCHGWYNELIA